MLSPSEALSSLEDDIVGLRLSAQIAARLADLPAYERVPDGRVRITLPLTVLELLGFAVIEVERRAIELDQKYQGMEISNGQ